MTFLLIGLLLSSILFLLFKKYKNIIYLKLEKINDNSSLSDSDKLGLHLLFSLFLIINVLSWPITMSMMILCLLIIILIKYLK